MNQKPAKKKFFFFGNFKLSKIELGNGYSYFFPNSMEK